MPDGEIDTLLPQRVHLHRRAAKTLEPISASIRWSGCALGWQMSSGLPTEAGSDMAGRAPGGRRSGEIGPAGTARP